MRRRCENAFCGATYEPRQHNQRFCDSICRDTAYRGVTRPARGYVRRKPFGRWKVRLTLDGCWEWVGSRVEAGYGRVHIEGKPVYAHRAAYERWVGPIPKGLIIHHQCNNRPCIKPQHLQAVTPSENQLAVTASFVNDTNQRS